MTEKDNRKSKGNSNNQDRNQSGQMIVTSGLLSATLVSKAKAMARTESQLLNAITSVNTQVSSAAKKAYDQYTSLFEELDLKINKINKSYRESNNQQRQGAGKTTSSKKPITKVSDDNQKSTKKKTAKTKKSNVTKATNADLKKTDSNEAHLKVAG